MSRLTAETANPEFSNHLPKDLGLPHPVRKDQKTYKTITNFENRARGSQAREGMIQHELLQTTQNRIIETLKTSGQAKEVNGQLKLTLTGEQTAAFLGLSSALGYSVKFPEPTWKKTLRELDQDIRNGVDLDKKFPRTQKTKQEESKKPWFLSKPAQIASAATTAIGSYFGVNQAINAYADGNPRASSPTPAIHEKLPTQNSQKALQEFARISTTPDDRYGPEVTQEWLEQNPQGIKATSYVTDANGNVTKQFVLLDNNRLYESDLDTKTGLFSDFQGLSQIPIDNPTSLITSSDGKIVIVGGETPKRSGITKLYVSFTGGKPLPDGTNWQEITWPYQLSGGTNDLFRFADGNYLGNNGNFEGGIGQFTISINQKSKIVRLQAASLATVQKTNLNLGSAYDLGVTAKGSTGTKVELASNGSLNIQEGFNLIHDFDYTTGSGTVENVTTVKVNGVDTNLGFLYGRGQYTDSQGHMHFVTNNMDRNLLYDIDITTKTATESDYTSWFGGKNLQNYGGIAGIMAIQIIDDGQGNKHVWLGGGYNSTVDGFPRTVIAHYVLGTNPSIDSSALTVYDIEPNKHSGILQQKDMQIKTINTQKGIEFIDIGKGFLPINSDGSPIFGAKPYRTNRGLGGSVVDFLKRVYIPFSTNGSQAGW